MNNIRSNSITNYLAKEQIIATGEREHIENWYEMELDHVYVQVLDKLSDLHQVEIGSYVRALILRELIEEMNYMLRLHRKSELKKENNADLVERIETYDFLLRKMKMWDNFIGIE
jgi:hypothetical protein